MKKLLLQVSLLAALAVQAVAGDTVSKTASGTTTAAAIFPALSRGRVTAYDVTADNATNRLFFYPGTTMARLAKPATPADTILVFEACSFATNNVILIQDATNGIVAATVSTNATASSSSIPLAKLLGTNLAIGDTFKEVLPTVYRPVARAASDATTIYLDGTTGLDTNDVVLLDRGEGLVPTKGTISTLIPTTGKFVRLNSPLPGDVAAGIHVLRVQTNVPTTLTVSQEAEETALFIQATNGMAAGTNLFIESANLGRRQVVKIDSLSGTNITLVSPGLTYNVDTNDLIYVLGPNTTVKLPSSAGSDSLILVSTNQIALTDTIVVSNRPAFRAQFAGLAADTNQYAMTLATAFGAVADQGNAIYKLTNTYTLRLAAANDSRTVVTDTATGLTAGDVIVISPASGGVFKNQIAGGAIETRSLTTVLFTAAPALSLAAGDRGWLQGAGVNTLIGAATVRQSGDALYGFPGAVPLRVLITGAAACSLNNVTVKYE